MHRMIDLTLQKLLPLRVRARNLYLLRKKKTKTFCLNDMHPHKTEVPSMVHFNGEIFLQSYVLINLEIILYVCRKTQISFDSV